MKKLKARDWQLITTNAEEIVFRSGDEVLVEQDEENFVYRIVEGTVKVEVLRSNGKRVLVNRLHPGAIFGEMSLLGRYDSQAVMIAESDEVHVQRLEVAFLTGIFKLEPNVGARFYKHVASILSHRIKTLPSQYKIAGDVRNEGIHRFNSKSGKEGIKFLVEEGYMKNTPEAVASFLRNNPELDKGKIGEYLADR